MILFSAPIDILPTYFCSHYSIKINLFFFFLFPKHSFLNFFIQLFIETIMRKIKLQSTFLSQEFPSPDIFIQKKQLFINIVDLYRILTIFSNKMIPFFHKFNQKRNILLTSSKHTLDYNLSGIFVILVRNHVIKYEIIFNN